MIVAGPRRVRAGEAVPSWAVAAAGQQPDRGQRRRPEPRSQDSRASAVSRSVCH